MNINTALFDKIEDDLYSYDCRRGEIEHFLSTPAPFLKRQCEAIKIIESIMTFHRKKELLKHVVQLARVEHSIRELEPWARDHVVHALLGFILGIYLNEKFLKTSGTFVDDFQWKLAGLFHDVGYPAQIAKDIILKPFTAKINEIRRNLDVQAQDVYFKVVPIGLENLTNDINSFDLMQNCLNKWCLQIDVRKEYKQMIESGRICHGMISSLAVLKIIDFMYQKYNPKRKYSDILKDEVNFNQKYFERDVVSACSAIFIHNLQNKCFVNAKIDRLKAPLAFLLKLSDCLQEWERPSLENPTGFAANLFDIEIKDGRLIFKARIPDIVKDKIKEEMLSYLLVTDVQIC